MEKIATLLGYGLIAWAVIRYAAIPAIRWREWSAAGRREGLKKLVRRVYITASLPKTSKYEIYRLGAKGHRLAVSVGGVEEAVERLFQYCEAMVDDPLDEGAERAAATLSFDIMRYVDGDITADELARKLPPPMIEGAPQMAFRVSSVRNVTIN